MNQQDRDSLSQNWEQAKTQIKAQFPDVTDDELASGQNDPDALVSAIASRTGQDETQVRSQVEALARSQQTGGQPGQSQTQR